MFSLIISFNKFRYLWNKRQRIEMKTIKNEKLIKRNSIIGQWTSLGALAILGIGMYISFTKPDLFTYSIICLLIGFMMTQVGMYMGNRWGR